MGRNTHTHMGCDFQPQRHPPLLVGRSVRQLGERLAHMADQAAVAPLTPSLQILMQALMIPLRVHADGRHAPTTVGGSSKTHLYFLLFCSKCKK